MNPLVSLLVHYRYLLLFPLAAIEGPIVSLVAGFVVRLGFLNFALAYIILIFGDIIPDSIYFYIGRYRNRIKFLNKYTSKYKFLSKNPVFMERLWNEHGRKTMFLGKLAYGFSIPFLISAGLVNMSYKKFISFTLPPTLFQYGLLMIVGFYLGTSYQFAIKYIRDGGIIIAIILVVFVFVYILTLRYARKQLSQTMEENNNLL